MATSNIGFRKQISDVTCSLPNKAQVTNLTKQLSLPENIKNNTLVTFQEFIPVQEGTRNSEVQVGHILKLLDVCSCLSAEKHAKKPCVTVTMDDLIFEKSIKPGDIVHFSAKVSRAFTTSMEVATIVLAESPETGLKCRIANAYFTYVSRKDESVNTPLVPIYPNSPTELQDFLLAAERRRSRLTRHVSIQELKQTPLISVKASNSNTSSNNSNKCQPPTYSETVKLVLPVHANHHGTTFGGQLMEWMTNIASMSSLRYSHNTPIVLAVDMITFKAPSHVGDRIVIKSAVNNVFNKSMEIMSWLNVRGGNYLLSIQRLAWAKPSTRKFTFQAEPLGKQNEPETDSQSGTNKISMTNLRSGIKIATHDVCHPFSQLSIALRAGARFQTEQTLGVTHLLMHNAYLTTRERTGFRISREIERIGATIDCELTRDYIIFRSTFLPGNEDVVLENICSAVNVPEYRHFEIDKDNVLLDLSRLPVHPNNVIEEAIHKLSYRRGLGFPLYSPECQVGIISNQTLRDFHASCFATENVTVFATGVSHESFVKQVEKCMKPLKIGSGNAPKTASKFYQGCESHTKLYGNNTSVMLVTEGVKIDGAKWGVFTVLQHLLDTGNQIKRGSNKNSRFGKSIHMYKTNMYDECFIKAININHSDTGLFGLLISAPSEHVKKVLETALLEFRSIARKGLAKDELDIAKHRAKTTILIEAEDPYSLHKMFTLSIATNGIYKTVDDMIDSINKVSSSEIIELVKTISMAKPNLAVVGNLADPPYLDQLI